jgi:uncharacterized MAPEG superfamily protein
MRIAYWCVLTAGLLPIVSVSLAKAGVKGYDNRMPRDWLAKLSGWQQRANAAQQNAWEAFALFAVAVILSALQAAPEAKVDTLALAFVAARVAYLGCYLADLATLRTLVWMIGFGCTLAIFRAGP